MKRRDFITGMLAGGALVAVPTFARRIWQVPRGAPVRSFVQRYYEDGDWMRPAGVSREEFMRTMQEQLIKNGKMQVISTPYRKRDWMKDFVPSGFDQANFVKLSPHYDDALELAGELKMSPEFQVDLRRTFVERTIDDMTLAERIKNLERVEAARGIQLAEPVRFVTIDGFVRLEDVDGQA